MVQMMKIKKIGKDRVEISFEANRRAALATYEKIIADKKAAKALEKKTKREAEQSGS